MASDCLTNIRSIKALTLEDAVSQRYMGPVKDSYKELKAVATKFGLAYGFGSALTFWLFDFNLYYGAKLYSDGELDAKELSYTTFTVFG